MKLKNAIGHFKQLLSQAENKTEKKIYEKFIRMLSGLEKLNLSNDEIEAIETELSRLHLNSTKTHSKRHYRKALSHFEKYLADTLSLTTKSYYTRTGIALGMTFGMLFGIVFSSHLERSTGIALGLSLGMFVGLLIGRNLDAKALSSGKTI